MPRGLLCALGAPRPANLGVSLHQLDLQAAAHDMPVLLGADCINQDMADALRKQGRASRYCSPKQTRKARCCWPSSQGWRWSMPAESSMHMASSCRTKHDFLESTRVGTLTHTLVQRLRNYCNALCGDGMRYGDYVEQLAYLLFLKMADKRSGPLQQ